MGPLVLPCMLLATLLFFLTYHFVAIFYRPLDLLSFHVRERLRMEQQKLGLAAVAALKSDNPVALDDVLSLEHLTFEERRKSTTAPAHHYYRRRERVPREALESTSSASSHPDHHDHHPDDATVKEHYPFNAGDDAKTLYKAMEGFGEENDNLKTEKIHVYDNY